MKLIKSGRRDQFTHLKSYAYELLKSNSSNKIAVQYWVQYKSCVWKNIYVFSGMRGYVSKHMYVPHRIRSMFFKGDCVLSLLKVKKEKASIEEVTSNGRMGASNEEGTSKRKKKKVNDAKAWASDTKEKGKIEDENTMPKDAKRKQ